MRQAGTTIAAVDAWQKDWFAGLSSNVKWLLDCSIHFDVVRSVSEREGFQFVRSFAKPAWIGSTRAVSSARIRGRGLE
jgi:hypothetical protein